MKTSLETGVGPGVERSLQGHRDWSVRSIISVLVAAAMLGGVYLLPGIFPDPGSDGSGFGLLGEFLGFWILGGLLTMMLLVFSDWCHGRR